MSRFTGQRRLWEKGLWKQYLMGGKSTAKAPKLERDKRIYRNSIGNSLVNLGKYQTGQHVLSLEKTG